jgi:hypothetical protein
MPHPDTFQALPPSGEVVHGSVPLSNGVVFYPDVTVKGLPVLLWGWNVESSDSILRCQIGQWSINERFKDPRKVREIVEGLQREGWKWNEGEASLFKFCHVEELEKIEGSPPDSGAF